jgi:hypothetical protein
MEKVGSPVQWIHNPNQPIDHHLRTELFSNDVSTGLPSLEHVCDHPFCGPIDLGNEVTGPFEDPPGRVGRPGNAAQIGSCSRGGGLSPMQ